MTDKPVVLFLCTHNAGRSLAAKVLVDHYAQGRIDVRSAGSEPAAELNPSVVAVLKERGLDPSQEFPKPLADSLAEAADVVVTMGCGDTWPVYPGKRYLDWDLRDPAGLPVEEVRPIVDQIDRRVHGLAHRGTAPPEQRRSACVVRDGGSVCAGRRLGEVLHGSDMSVRPYRWRWARAHRIGIDRGDGCTAADKEPVWTSTDWSCSLNRSAADCCLRLEWAG
jgi:protein-tyrosine-phosphatase